MPACSKLSDLNAAYGVIPVLHDVELEDASRVKSWPCWAPTGPGKPPCSTPFPGSCPVNPEGLPSWARTSKTSRPIKSSNQGISQIPEGRKIFPYLTVKENLLMGACTLKAWRKRQEMLEKVYALFPILKERAGQRASLMSGGEQQMLVIARGLMARPRFLMIDEPSLGLSPLIMSQIYEVIKTFPGRRDYRPALRTECPVRPGNRRPGLCVAGRSGGAGRDE